MTRAWSPRLSWLAPCMAGIWLCSPQVFAAGEPREWLEKMNQALASRNYDGTFFHLSQDRVETMRIVHRVRGGRVTERLQSLDGSGREFVRNNDELTCYLPDQHTVLVEPRQDRGPFLGTLPQFNADVNNFYRIEALPDSRVLNRPVRVIAVTPSDQFRFGYRLWLDEKTAMPLKTQLCDGRGQVLEQIVFAKLDMPDSIADSELVPAVRTEGMRWVRQGALPGTTPPTLSAMRARDLPPGFHLTVEGAQTLGDAASPASHLVYSDGLATVSVFVEMQAVGAPVAGGSPAVAAPMPMPGDTPPEAPVQGLAKVGSGYAYSTISQGYQVTAVGEVPAKTVESIARSVKTNGEPAPSH